MYIIQASSIQSQSSQKHMIQNSSDWTRLTEADGFFLIAQRYMRRERVGRWGGKRGVCGWFVFPKACLWGLRPWLQVWPLVPELSLGITDGLSVSPALERGTEPAAAQSSSARLHVGVLCSDRTCDLLLNPTWAIKTETHLWIFTSDSYSYADD